MNINYIYHTFDLMKHWALLTANEVSCIRNKEFEGGCWVGESWIYLLIDNFLNQKIGQSARGFQMGRADNILYPNHKPELELVLHSYI